MSTDNAREVLERKEPEGDPATVDLALARSVLFGSLAATFGPSGPAGRRSLFDPRGRVALRAAARLLDETIAAAPEMLPAVRRLDDVSVSPEDLARDYERLVGHTARGLVCPYETEYGAEGLFHQPQALADISGFYRAFGLALSSDERPDHVGCECEFLAFMTSKEAYLLAELQEGPPDRETCETTLAETRRAVRLFLRDHLGKFGMAFAGSLMREPSSGAYAGAGDVLAALLRLESVHTSVALGPPTLPLRAGQEENVPMGCGDASELIQIERRRR